MTENTANDVQLVITRTLNAPRELVYKVWTEPAHLAKWWGPKGLDVEVVRFELRPGGLFHFSMKTPDGHVMWGKFVYGEIQAPEKLVFNNSFADEAGNTIRAPFSPVFPLEVQNILTFEEHGEQTIMTLRGGTVHATEEELAFFKGMHDSMNQGFGGTFDQLDEYLAQVTA
jgi:uncharacterized protein YndB with AHSA1/START domain